MQSIDRRSILGKILFAPMPCRDLDAAAVYRWQARAGAAQSVMLALNMKTHNKLDCTATRLKRKFAVSTLL